jgi:hypothetical protein
MEWFFATTEGFLPGTSIMVFKNTYPSAVKFEDLLPGSWKAGKCIAAVVG